MSLIPNSYYDILAHIESGGKNGATNKTTGAAGLYQFLPSTFKGMGYSTSDLHNLTVEQQAVQQFTQSNASILHRNGIGVDSNSLYAAHFLGAGTASKVLNAPDNAPLSNYISGEAIKANPQLHGMSVGGFKSWVGNKTGKAAKAVGAVLSDPLGAGRSALQAGGATIGGWFGNADAGRAVGNTLADINQKVGQAALAITDPFASVTDGIGLTGDCSWLCQFQKWISDSGFFQRLALAVFALLLIAAALFMLKSVRETVVTAAAS